MSNPYCKVCGGETDAKNERSWICRECKGLSFSNPCPGADVALFNDAGEVLLSERAEDPKKGYFNLPGGFVEAGETLEQGAYRELQEELQIDTNDYSDIQYVGSFFTKYAFSNQVYDVVGAVYAARILNPEKIVSQDDSKSVKFVPLEDLDDIMFSSDTYPEIIRTEHAKLFGTN